MEYKLKYETQPNNPNLKCEEPVYTFTYSTKKEAHLYWLNCARSFISHNIMFDKSKKARYKIFTEGTVREVRDISDNSVRVRITKLY